MSELILISAGALIYGLTNFLKRFTDINPLVVAAFLAIVGGLAYAGLELTGYWQAIKAFVMVAYPISVLIYQFIKQAREYNQPKQ